MHIDKKRYSMSNSTQKAIEVEARRKVKEYIRKGFTPERIASEINQFLRDYDKNAKLFY